MVRPGVPRREDPGLSPEEARPLCRSCQLLGGCWAPVPAQGSGSYGRRGSSCLPRSEEPLTSSAGESLCLSLKRQRGAPCCAGALCGPIWRGKLRGSPSVCRWCRSSSRFGVRAAPFLIGEGNKMFLRASSNGYKNTARKMSGEST